MLPFYTYKMHAYPQFYSWHPFLHHVRVDTRYQDDLGPLSNTCDLKLRLHNLGFHPTIVFLNICSCSLTLFGHRPIVHGKSSVLSIVRASRVEGGWMCPVL